MIKNNIYSTQKILHHPSVIEKLRNGIQPYPIQIHLMPQNKCNHNCSFCSYRIEDNKNNQLFDGTSHIPKDVMIGMMDDFKTIGVKAIELTGGGEPLLYPHKDIMFGKILEHGFDYSLVTNGTLLSEELAKQIAPKMSWGRVSIDAGTPTTYAGIREVSHKEYNKALKAIEYLRKYSENPEFRLGMGFTVTNENAREIVPACCDARAAGADNVRVSACFHPDGYEYFTEETREAVRKQKDILNNMQTDTFKIFNFFDERMGNLAELSQPYKFCGTKEVLCVIGGNCDVYYCCSLAFSRKGLIGNIKEQSIIDLWDSDHKHNLFSRLDASKLCTCACLYESRNVFINSLLNKPPHVNFI